ncbi:MAG: tRNA (adenosine(37)-N6)-threonylcarbamoyltransferase complex dimerization subunit type 1 TsaB, partial [Candidatus Zixiibacteriota bacterium]
MNLLAFDSTSPILTVGIAGDGRAFGRWDTQSDRSRGGTLDQLINRALEESGLCRRNINALAIVTGPGSLTALRIGWATACGWALTTGIPVTGWPVPAVQRRKWVGESIAGRPDSRLTRSTNVTCLVHHRGAEFYVYDWNAMSTGRLPIVTTRDEFRPVVNPDAWVIGPGLLHNYDDWL